MVQSTDCESRYERSDVPSLEEQNIIEEMDRRKRRRNPLAKVFALLAAVLLLNGTLVFAAVQHMQWREAALKLPELMPVAGLSGTRSQITGILDPTTLTASYYWTFVVHNATTAQQEAQINLLLPPRATVSRATLWVNGVPEEAAFNSTQRVEQAYNWITRMHRDPLLVTQTAPRVISIKAAPVQPNQDMEFRLGITAAGVLRNGKVLYGMPRVTAANLDVNCKQDVHLVSQSAIQSSSSKLQTLADPQDDFLCKGSINPADLAGLVITSDRKTDVPQFATRATHSMSGSFILAKLVPLNSSTSQLALMKTNSLPAGVPILGWDEEAFRLSTLWAFGEIEKLAPAGGGNLPGQLATTYRVVSCVSGATVLENQSDYQYQTLTRDPYMVTSYLSQNFVLPMANISFVYPVSTMAPFQTYGSQPHDGIFANLTLVDFLSFGFARGALQNTLSQSFSTVVMQLNALNSYSAAGSGTSYSYSPSAYSGFSSGYPAPASTGGGLQPASWTANGAGNNSAEAQQALANMETQNRALHDCLFTAGSFSGALGCGLSNMLLRAAYGNKSLSAELFGTPDRTVQSIAVIDIILLLVVLNFAGPVGLIVKACRLGNSGDPERNNAVFGGILWMLVALVMPDLSQILALLGLTGAWVQKNEARAQRTAAA